ncbi:enoyl-CoA hydratase/isomerase family protein [Microbacterium sp. ZW T5_56]|uniref:enoyl-CoA hydratase/isomerase family protein n=1 Tax=Microbacterium sp. ZW T5_56 TaxID=3378081 RepID=UPI003854038F
MSEIVTRTSGRVHHVILHRPDKRNALTAGMIDALHAAVDDAEAAGAAVLVITADGPMFCAGADIAGYRDAAEDPVALRVFTDRARGLCERLTRTDLVVVAGVGGTALGGGFELVLAADIVIAAEGARFGLPELKLGLIPGWGGTQRLTAQLGPARAKRVILLGDTLMAAELHEAGLIARLVADADELERTVATVAESLAAGPSAALAAAKHAITAAYDAEAGYRIEREGLLALFGSPDGREGVRAFVEKRPAVWIGR